MRINSFNYYMAGAVIFEWLFLYTLLVPFNNQHWGLFGPLLCLGIIYSFLFWLIRKKFSKVSLAIYFLITFITMVIGLLFFHISAIMSLLIGVFFYFRSTRLLEQKSPETVWQQFFISAAMTVVYYLFTPILLHGFEHKNYFIVLLVVQFFAAILMISNGDQRQGGNKRLPLFILGFFAVGLIVAELTIVLKPVLFAVIDFVVKAVALAIITVTSALYNWLVIPFISDKSEDKLKSTISMNDSSIKKDQTFHEYNPPDYLIWVIIGVVLIIAILIFVILRKRKPMVGDFQLNAEISGRSLIQNETKGRINKRRKARRPKDPVRLGMYQLQKYAQKIGLGRYRFESLEEWFKRTEVTETIEPVQHYYEKARYGGKPLTDNEFADYTESINRMKTVLKDKEGQKDTNEQNNKD